MIRTVKMGTEKNRIIEIGGAICGQLEAIGQKQGYALEDEVAEAIKVYIEQMNEYSNDSFFQIGKAGKSGVGDLAKAHDKYLYPHRESE